MFSAQYVPILMNDCLLSYIFYSFLMNFLPVNLP